MFLNLSNRLYLSGWVIALSILTSDTLTLDFIDFKTSLIYFLSPVGPAPSFHDAGLATISVQML